MRRIAYLSPINPAPSGISDYSEELLPYLGQYADVTLFVADGLRPSNAQLMRHLEVQPIRRLQALHRRQPFDAMLYHLGNSAVHAEIWRAAQAIPGVVVLHEWVLHHFMLWYAVNTLRRPQHYRKELVCRYGSAAESVADEMLRGRLGEAAFAYPLSEAVVEGAQGLLAHSDYVLHQARALRPSLPMARVPMGVPLPPLRAQAQARQALGLPADALLLASFGHINPYKRLDAVLRALRQLRDEGIDARYLLVGSVSPHVDLAGLTRRAGVEPFVTATGYVARDAFESYLASADVCLNLRHPTAGETSASLLRLLGAGKPTLVTATGSFAELPPHVAAQVDLDAEEPLILAYCRLFVAQPELAQRLGAAARSFVATEHSLERAAAGYMSFLEQLYGWEPSIPLRPPLWPVNALELLIQPATPPASFTGQPNDKAPLTAHFIQQTAQALAEIGGNESDTALLRRIADDLTFIAE